ncbi:MAG: isoamylase early set domain-containing protein [Chloroflexi bacterium]|nr:isoamylase early set domain-containing protein [Chloroflexota bacterium]
MMLSKNYSKTGSVCRVTFKLPADVGAETAVIAGDFNGWSTESHPMKKLKDGSLSVVLSLTPGKAYRFRYLLDGDRWENDWEADAYLPNSYGEDDSVVQV